MGTFSSAALDSSLEVLLARLEWRSWYMSTSLEMRLTLYWLLDLDSMITACEYDQLLCEVITKADTAVDIITYIDKTCGVEKPANIETSHQLQTDKTTTMSEVSLMIKKQEKKMTEVFVKKTHFTFLEIEKLFQLYRDHAEDLDSMDRNTFREFLHDVFNMTDDILMDRIFKYFDTVNDGNITREEWIMGLNVFLKGS